MGKTLVALYPDTETARQVVASLVEAGFSIDDIRLLVNDDASKYDSRDNHTREFAALGALVGGLVGVGMMLVQGAGAAIEASALGVLITAGIGAAAGAVTGGISAELVDVDGESNPNSYSAEMRQSGATIVSLTTNEQWLEWAERIMGRYEPLKLEERDAQWYGSGWAKFEIDHDASRKLRTIQDRSSMTMRQIKSSTSLHPRAQGYEYRN